jgi:hypothetical protein
MASLLYSVRASPRTRLPYGACRCSFYYAVGFWLGGWSVNLPKHLPKTPLKIAASKHFNPSAIKASLSAWDKTCAFY